MRHQVTIHRPALAMALRQLLRNPHAVAWGSAGLSSTHNRTELLCSALHTDPPHALSLTAPAVVLTFTRGDGLPLRHPPLQAWWSAQQRPPAPVAILAFQHAWHQGSLTAVWLTPTGERTSVDMVHLVGPGMQRMVPAAGQEPACEAMHGPDGLRWSRVMGALGEATWQRLCSLRYCLVGAGRTGSLVALSLARLGVEHLTLIDPDRIELHNIDAMDGVVPADVGRLKVCAVRDAVRALQGTGGEIQAVADSITTLRALCAVKDADVLITCVDDDGARLLAGVFAALYAKPLVDIGTGILHTARGKQLGGDIRLILPGERCLWCFGGIAHPEHVQRLLTPQPPGGLPRPAWHAERAGSLRSLNQLAAHLGLRLLEELVEERVQQSTWLHLEYDAQGLPRLDVLAPPAQGACALCTQTATGDKGATAARAIVQALLDP